MRSTSTRANQVCYESVYYPYKQNIFAILTQFKYYPHWNALQVNQKYELSLKNYGFQKQF